MANLLTKHEILSALAWQAAAGADEALEDTPYDWSAPKAAAPIPLNPAPTPTISRPKADLSNIKTLDELKAALEAIQGLSIKDTAMNLVFGEGALNPPIMFVG